jgi:shikimate kinase
MKKLIYLTGFMGSGKSAIGPILSNTIGWEFFDLDRVIETRFNKRVTEIFENNGEAYFREQETGILSELALKDNAVISLGGGTIASEVNLQILKKNSLIIYLKTSPEVVYERLKNKRDRPIFKNETSGEVSRKQFLEKIKKLMENRVIYYEQADVTFSTDHKSIGLTVDEIAKYVYKEIR